VLRWEGGVEVGVEELLVLEVLEAVGRVEWEGREGDEFGPKKERKEGGRE